MVDNNNIIKYSDGKIRTSLSIISLHTDFNDCNLSSFYTVGSRFVGLSLNQ